MTKIYGIYGYRELNIHIPLANGRNFIQREFTRGNPQQGAYYRPATYVSSDEVEQDMIEGSPLFGRLIKLYRICDDSVEQERQVQKQVKRASRGPVKISSNIQPAPEEEHPVADSEGPAEVHDEITTREELISFLKSQGAKATVLADDTKMNQFIEKNGYIFPNLTI